MEVFTRFEVKTFSKSKGHSAIAGSAYRTGQELYCERSDKVFSFTNKKDVISVGMSKEYKSSEMLWNDAERCEKRKDATIQREFLVSLDKRLDEKSQKRLANRICREIQEKHKCLYEYAIHKGKEGNQPHIHIIMTTRRYEEGKFTGKVRELDNRKSGEVKKWREWVERESRDVLRNQLRRDDPKQSPSLSYRKF